MKTTNLLLVIALLGLHPARSAENDKSQPSPLLTQPADKLVAILKSDAGVKEKSDACRELSVVGNKRALPALIALLPDEHLNEMARYALETMPDAGVNPALRGELAKLQGRQLVGVIGSLGVRRDTKAVRPLAKFLTASDPEVAQAAARALGKIGSADAAKAIQAALPKTAPANQLAFYEGWLHCAETLAATGKSKSGMVIYDTIRSTADLPPQVRAGAVRGAILTRGTKGVTLLKECLASGDYNVFAAAIRTSCEIPGLEVTQTLIAGLTGMSADRQVVTIQALGQRGGGMVVTSLASFVRTGEKPVRIAALRAIAATDQPAALPLLVETLADSDGDISRAAQDGLAGLTDRAADAAVLTLANSANAGQRIIGIELIGRRRMVASVPVLLTAVSDADDGVRSAGFKRWGELAGPGDAPAMIQLLLQMTRPGDLTAAEQALSTLCQREEKPEAVCDLVAAAIPQAQPAPKAALLGVLGSAGVEKSLPTVRAAVNDPTADVRGAAVKALADWPKPSVMPDLLNLAKSSADPEKSVALRGYIRLVGESSGSPAEKVKMMSEVAAVANSQSDKMLVLAGLGEISDVESLKMAASYLSDAALADEAGAAVVKIAAKLPATDKEAIGAALNQVLQSAKSEPVLEKARKRKAELGF